MKGPNYRRIVPLILSIGLLFILFSCGKEKVEEMLPPRVNFRLSDLVITETASPVNLLSTPASMEIKSNLFVRMSNQNLPKQ